MSAVAEPQAVIPFPSTAWFDRLAELMEADRARHEHLGFIDCVAEFIVTNESTNGYPRHFRVTFEEFEAVDVREVKVGDDHQADFSLTAVLDTWREMITSIAAGNGRPDLEHTLNRLSHMGTPITLTGPDPVKTDLYFRYAQSLQEFFNASASFETAYPDAD